MPSISSNHLSLDQQASDALDYLRLNHADAYTAVRRNFAENIVFESGPGGCNFDTDAMGVDEEWGSWLVDAIEETDRVRWIDGEPYAAPYPDDEDEAM